MFAWFKKKGTADTSMSHQWRRGVDSLIALTTANEQSDDEAIMEHLISSGSTELEARDLVRFVPIACTRFLFRKTGIQFAADYVLLDANSQPVATKAIGREPAYMAAWECCEEATINNRDTKWIVSLAARSAGFRAIAELQQKGTKLAGIKTGPPMMFE